jgi:hypothetical protein
VIEGVARETGVGVSCAAVMTPQSMAIERKIEQSEGNIVMVDAMDRWKTIGGCNAAAAKQEPENTHRPHDVNY